MNKDVIQKAILDKKPKGVRYIHTHKALIQALINKGNSKASIYMALKKTDCPPPISKSQFYRHIKNLNLTPESSTREKQSSSGNLCEADPKHDAVNNMGKSSKPIHDNTIDADNLI